ncbi:class I SAM-dependent methyltransferase [Candidatus Hydrogenedentota bacterium]
MRASRIALGVAVTAAAVLEASCVGPAETNTPLVLPSIPYVATRNDAVRDMLWIANVGKDDVVYDLGSGDGRIVIAAVRDFGARRAVGIEIDPERIRESRENARKAGVEERVEFIQGDLFTTDFRQASVVTLFLGHGPNIRLRPKMLSVLKPGTRIVSHQFAMGEWQPDKALTVRTVGLGMWGEGWNPFKDNPRVPDYTGNEMHHGSNDKIAMWVVPAPMAGVWRGKIETAQGAQDCQLVLRQRLSEVTGTFQIFGKANLTGGVGVDVWGEHVRFECRPGNMGYGQYHLMFDGHIHKNRMRGTLVVRDQGRLEEYAWEVKRDKADITGTWEWPCATGSRSVQLRIERREGHFIATYLDRDKAVPITDFYDWGGGFYFTLMIGREGNSLVHTEDTGWLIGEGVLDQGALKGMIEFYPYGYVDMSDEGKVSPTVIRNWTPRLIKP